MPKGSTSFERLYHEEAHLFDVIGPRFRENGRLDAYDFLFIVRWKANRSISRVARRLLLKGGPKLDGAVAVLTREISKAEGDHEKFLVLVRDWGFRLPMASAILTVLYPEEFTVYDIRACNQLGDFQSLTSISDPEKVWRGYGEFRRAVKRRTPARLSLREKDRFLWARSRHEDLVSVIKRGFRK